MLDQSFGSVSLNRYDPLILMQMTNLRLISARQNTRWTHRDDEWSSARMRQRSALDDHPIGAIPFYSPSPLIVVDT